MSLDFSVWYVFCLFIIFSEKAGPKRSYFIAPMDFDHCHLLPHLVRQREDSRPLFKLPFHSCVYSVKPFSQLPSEDILFKSKILLFVSPH